MSIMERDAHLARLDELGDEIATLAAEIHAATARFLRLVGEFDRLKGWHEAYCKSCAHWVSWRCGIALGAAREHVRVAQRLPAMPLIHAAFERGELSYSKVRALTRMDHLDQEKEQEMLDLARGATASQLEKMIRAYRGVIAANFGEARDERFLSVSADDDGSFRISGRLGAEEGALLQAALEQALNDIYREGRPKQRPVEEGELPDDLDAPKPTNIDALIRLTEHYQPDAERTAIADRYQVVVHVDQEALAGGNGAATLADGTPVPRETVQMLCCEAAVIVASERNGVPMNMGRKTRPIPTALRRALRRRDGDRCLFPGCTNKRVDAHHFEHWGKNGHTDLDNLMSLCRFHHSLAHKDAFAIRRTDTGFTFHRRDGRRIHESPTLPHRTADDLLERNLDAAIITDGKTCGSAFAGDRLDLAYAVDALFSYAPHPDDPPPNRRGRSPRDDESFRVTVTSRPPAKRSPRSADPDADADPWGYGRQG
jgi:hypothetical protein